MEQSDRKRWVEPTHVVDLIQGGIAVVAGVALALDATGLIKLPWLQDNLSELTFVAICALIVSSVLERRFTLRSFQSKAVAGLDEIEGQLQKLRENTAGLASVDAILKDRRQFELSFEGRISSARSVCISGTNLKGLVSHYHSLFLDLAREGCELRFLIDAPSLRSKSGRKTTQQTLVELGRIQRVFPERVHIRTSPEVQHCSIIILDGEESSGEIQVEFYVYGAQVVDRPHFTVTSVRDPKWYQRYKAWFEALWKASDPYNHSDNS